MKKNIERTFVAPACIIVAIATQIPFILTIIFSTLRWNILRPDQGIKFVGIKNFKYYLTDSEFYIICLQTIVLIGSGPVHGIRLSDRADAGLRCAGEDAFADIDLKPVLRHDDHHRRTLEDDDIEYELRVGRNDRRYAGNKSD